MTDYVDNNVVEFPAYHVFLEKLVNCLTGLSGSEVIFTVHPSTTDSERSRIESLGALISDNQTHLLIAESDLYIASISATIQWAIAAGVPTLNYDYFCFGYPDYESSELVIRADTFSSFEHELVKISSSLIANLDAVRADSNNSSPLELDGKSGRKLILALEKLFGRK
jgi:hypothetical protein